jgi:hypothetical protein
VLPTVLELVCDGEAERTLEGVFDNPFEEA